MPTLPLPLGLAGLDLLTLEERSEFNRMLSQVREEPQVIEWPPSWPPVPMPDIQELLAVNVTLREAYDREKREREAFHAVRVPFEQDLPADVLPFRRKPRKPSATQPPPKPAA
jgi:hypothetical protein